MHVGGLQLITPPPDAPPEFVSCTSSSTTAVAEPRSPWNTHRLCRWSSIRIFRARKEGSMPRQRSLV